MQTGPQKEETQVTTSNPPNPMMNILIQMMEDQKRTIMEMQTKNEEMQKRNDEEIKRLRVNNSREVREL